MDIGIDFKAELNDEQYEAVTAPIGPSLILAGAGSGKTRTLTYRVAWLLSQGVAPWEILLLTFTNKAAREMLERVEDLTGVPGYKFWGGTFHHIGQKILRMHGESVGVDRNFNILDASDSESLLGEVIKDTDAAFLKNKDNPKARVLAGIMSYARNTGEDLSHILATRYPYFERIEEQILDFARKYEEKKKAQQVLDYDDLMVRWKELMEKDSEVLASLQGRFKAILVDEYQDTNHIQSSLVNLLAKDHQVMVVGDDAQCIYTWRGADFENIMSFSDKHPGSKIYKIETNYRSSPQILNLANAVLENQPEGEGFKKQLRPVKEEGDLPRVIAAMDTRMQAQIVNRLVHDYVRRGYRLSDMAILYRAHFHAMDMQMELTRSGVPYQITSGVKFFDQAHIKDLVAQLRFANNPMDTAAFYRFVCLLPKVGPKTAERILKEARKVQEETAGTLFKVFEDPKVVKKVPEVARESWMDLVYTLQDVSEGIATRKPLESVKITVEGWYGDYMKTLYPNWRTRVDDLESIEGFAVRFDNMADLLSQLVLMNSETTNTSVDMDEDSLRMTTIHQAKGLEYPIVFVIGLADNLFPLKRAIEEGNLEEERRLFYVAVTRAMEHLFLVYPRVMVQGGPPAMLDPSLFLHELPDDVYESMQMR